MMTLGQLIVIALSFTAALPGVWAGENKNKNQDDDGFFYFQDTNDWSQSALYPMSCIETKNGDAVVYSIYNKNHNQCRKNQMGTYKMSVEDFVRAYIKQVQQEYEKNGKEYQVDGQTMAYLQCQEYYYNNNLYYMKVGCRNTGKGFQVHAYTDMYCTQKATMNYNMGIDISSLRVSFETCKACVATSGYNQYNNNQYNNNQNQYDNYYNNGITNQHDSMLCSSANHYKETCNRACRRAARKTSSSSSRSALSGEGFSPLGKFFLWVLSLSAVFFLLAALAQRKKMSKQDAMLEDAAIKSSGVDKKYIPRIFVAFILFIIVLILLKKKALTWFFLVAINIALLGYWMHLKKKAEQNAAVSGFQLYGDGGATA